MPTSTVGNNLCPARGFTLVELLIVMAIAGISVSLVMSAFTRLTGAAQEKQWVEKTLRELNRVHVKAILSGKPQQVELDFSIGALLRTDGEAHTPLLSLPENYAFALQSPDSTEKMLHIVYYPDGSASEARFDLLTPGKGRNTIRVRGLTGQAELLAANPS